MALGALYAVKRTGLMNAYAVPRKSESALHRFRVTTRPAGLVVKRLLYAGENWRKQGAVRPAGRFLHLARKAPDKAGV